MAQAATDPDIVKGVITRKTDEMIVLDVPDTSYQLHLVVKSPIKAEVDQRVEGRIYARAKRVDPIRSGGRYVEPVIGRPRRLQGRVLGADDAAGALLVDCGVPVIAILTTDQKTTDFPAGQMVTFDVERGATLEPVHR